MFDVAGKWTMSVESRREPVRLIGGALEGCTAGTMATGATRDTVTRVPVAVRFGRHRRRVVGFMTVPAFSGPGARPASVMRSRRHEFATR